MLHHQRRTGVVGSGVLRQIVVLVLFLTYTPRRLFNIDGHSVQLFILYAIIETRSLAVSYGATALVFVSKFPNFLLLIKRKGSKLISSKCDVYDFSFELFDSVN